MPKQVWISADCDEGALVNKLNDLDSEGYMPWELRYMDVQDSQQDPINSRKIVGIIAHAKSLKT
jgi:hypothetical protein